MTRKTYRFLKNSLAVTIHLTLTLAAGPLSAAVSYLITDLQPLTGGSAHAQSINDLGEIAGFSDTSISSRNAVNWTWQQGDITSMPHDLGQISPFTAKGDTWNIKINNLGQVLGNSNMTGINQAVIWDKGSSTGASLDTLGGIPTTGTGINNAGQVLGTNNSTSQAFVWQKDSVTGEVTVTPLLTPPNSGVTNNNTGQVALAQNGNLVVLPGSSGFSVNGATSGINGLNDLGQVAGNRGTTPTIWLPDGSAISLNGGGDAYAMNNAGQVVGQNGNAILWYPNSNNPATGWSKQINLNDPTLNLLINPLNLRLDQAFAINNLGQIVGVASINTAPSVQVDHGFLATPTGMLEWNGGASGLWDNPANWDSGLGFTPNAILGANISAPPSGDVFVTGPVAATTVSSLSVGGGGGVATLNLNQGGLTIRNGLTISANGVLVNQAGLNVNETSNIAGSLDNQGNLINTGALTNQGTVSNSGSLDNQGIFNNQATLTNLSGASLSNSAGKTLTNTGTFTNQGGVSNAGALDNQRTLDNQQDFTNLSSGNFNNAIDSTLTNTGTFTNQGTAGNSGSLDNQGNLVNTGGLTNLGTVSNAGSMGNGGTFTNQGTITSSGSLDNQGIFNNQATLTNLSGASLSNSAGKTLTNTGTFINQGGVSNAGALDNQGTLNNQATLTNLVGAALNNAAGKNITNTGTFSNQGTVGNAGSLDNQGNLINTGALTNLGTVSNAGFLGNGGTFANQGTVTSSGGLDNQGIFDNQATLTNLSGASLSNSAGKTLTNTGVFTNQGAVGNAGTLDNQGVLDNQGTLTNQTSGILNIASGSRLLNTGIVTNSGTVNLQGAWVDSGVTSNFGNFKLSGGNLEANSLVNQSVFNYTAGSFIGNLNNQATVNVNGAGLHVFNGNVLNQGTFNVHETSVSFTGNFDNQGAYISDPSTSQFNNLSVGSNGYISGGSQDNFIVTGNFANASTQNTQWNTANANLVFTSATPGQPASHQMQLAGQDVGAKAVGAVNNFAWGSVTLSNGDRLTLADGNATPGAALYARQVNLPGGVGELGNISSNYNVYFDPTLPANQPLLGGGRFGSGGGLLLPWSFVPFATGTLNDIALTPNEKDFSSALNEACTAPRGSLTARCVELQGLGGPQQKQAIASLTPDQVPAQTSMPVQFGATRMDAPLARLATLRAGGGAPFALNINGLSIPVNRKLANLLGPDAKGGAAGADTELFRDSPLGVFIQTRFNFGDMDTNTWSRGFNSQTRNVTVGADYRFTDQLVAGVAFNYTNVSTNYVQSSGRMDSDTYMGAVYGSYYLPHDFYVDWVANYGGNNYAFRRQFQYAGFAGQSNSSPGGNQYSFAVSGGKEFNWQEWLFNPYLRLEYLNLHIDAYDESGGGGFAIATGGQTNHSFVTDLGLQISHAVSLPWGVVTPSLRVEWEHQYLNDNRAVNMRLSDASAGLGYFSVQTGNPDRDYLNLGGSFSAALPNGGGAFIRYETRLSQAYISEHIVEGGVRLTF